jgi:hypothetical protein
MRRLFGADSLRSNNAAGGRPVAALRRRLDQARLFGADSLRSNNAAGARLVAALRPARRVPRSWWRPIMRTCERRWSPV